MATSYTSLLGLALPANGDTNWGTTINDSMTTLVDSAVAGTTTLSSDADVTLSTTTGTANQARQSIILWTAGGTATRYITAPAASKPYIVINKTSSTQSIVLRGVGPTTGITIAANESCVAAWNGSDFVKVSTSSAASVTGNNAFTGANTFYNSTGQTFGTATSTQDGIVLAGRAGGSSSYRSTIQPGTLSANRTITLPDNTGTVLTTGAAVTVGQGGTGQTSNLTQYGVIYGSTTTAMASTAAGTSTQVLHGNASGAPTWSAVSLSADVTGTLPIANGGTGQTTATEAFDALSPTTTLGDITYRGASDNLRLAGNTTTTKNFLSQTGTGSVSAAPAWSTVTKSDVGLSNVENTALSTWAGSSNITTVGTLSSLTVSGAVTFSSTTNSLNLGTSLTAASVTIGGASQTGDITLGLSTGTQQINIASNNTTSGNTKTLYIGSNALSGSTTNIVSGSSASGATVTHSWYAGGPYMRLDSSGNLGVGSAPTAGYRLDLTAAEVKQRMESTTGTNPVTLRYVNTGGAFELVQAGSSAYSTAPAYSVVLWHQGNYPMVFATNNTERARFAATGSFTVKAGAQTTPVAVTFSATSMTVDCTLSNVFTTTFTANVTSAPTISNPQDGQTINWFITQDATGSRTMTWPTSFKWPGGTAGVLSTAANAVDLVTATYRSATGFWYATLLKAFS